MESSNHNVLIMGGSGGLGLELTKRFLKNEDHVAVHFFKNKASVETVLKEFDLRNNALVCQADVRKESSVHAMFERLRHQWSHLDSVIYTAGITDDTLMSKMTEKQWNHVIQVNLTGLFYCMKHASQWMRDNKKGHILAIASRSGLTGQTGQANYAASKAGVIGLTRAAAKEWGPDQIQVNTVLPGFLPTAMGLKVERKKQDQIIQENVLQKPSTLEEVSRFIFFLSRMRHVSGQVFNLDSRMI
ncbi:MAG: SDR family NAD(P)-dependent oxidoreductase [Nitrospiria bacterium]